MDILPIELQQLLLADHLITSLIHRYIIDFRVLSSYPNLLEYLKKSWRHIEWLLDSLYGTYLRNLQLLLLLLLLIPGR